MHVFHGRASIPLRTGRRRILRPPVDASLDSFPPKIGKVRTLDYPYMLENRKRPDRLPVLIAAHRTAVVKARKAPLFPSLCRRPVSGAGGLSLTFRRLMSKVGISCEDELLPKAKGKGRRFFALGFHSLRHTAISEQANHGVSKEIRMKLSGHKSNVHEQYTHHELETLRRNIEKVPTFIPTSRHRNG